MKATVALAVMAATLLAGCSSPAPATHRSSAGALATCKPQDDLRCRSSSPSPDSASSSTPPKTGTPCSATGAQGRCGPYSYPQIAMSNGFNTYTGNNCWSDPSCNFVLTSYNPGNWSVTGTEPAGHTGVQAYSNTSQLTNDWNGSGWGSGGITPHTDTPISALTSLSSSYAETMPHNSGTIAQAAWDIWLDNNGGHPDEVMVWVDNVNRGSGGAVQAGTTTVNGQDWTLYQYRGGELIWSLGAPGNFVRQGSGAVNLLALLNWLQAHGFVAPKAAISQLQFGWEICSTGGVKETFTVNSYHLKSGAR
jgi:hypothetical protein